MLVPIGVAGAVLAALCAVVAAIAIVRGAGGLAGGAVGIWIPAAVLSLAASFANQWMPAIVAASALVGMLVIGTVVRLIVNAGEPARAVRRDARAAEAALAAETAPASKTAAPAQTGSVALAG